MIVKAHAKINPFLKITGVRSDGYHDLDLIFLPITLCDTLEAERNESGELKLTCSDPAVPIEENLITKAYHMVRADHPDLCGLNIKLTKRIPSGAGLGGGSADAAAFLDLLAPLCGLDLKRDELFSYAGRLGADVPALLLGTPSRGAGIGERLTPLTCNLSAELLIVSPGFFCSTKEMYGRFDDRTDLVQPEGAEAVCSALEQGDFKALCSGLFNVFEQLLSEKQRQSIGQIKQKMRDLGAAGALMTGSGSCVAGLFETGAQRDRAAAELAAEYEVHPASLCGM